MTLNQYVDVVHRFADAHKMIQGSFFWGTHEQYCDNKGGQYPVLIMVTKATTTVEGTKTFSSEFGVWDKVELDRSNSLSVFSDTEQICDDLIAFLTNLSYSGSSIDTVTAGVIEHDDQVFADVVAGSYFDCSVTQFFSMNGCSVPIDVATIIQVLGAEETVALATEDGKLLQIA